MPVDPVGKKVGDGELKLPLDNPTVIDTLRKGNIHDVHKLLTDYGITVADFEQFASNQHAKYMSNLVQAEPLYEGEATVPSPDIEFFSEHDPSNTLSEKDLQTANLSIGKALGLGKAEGGIADESTAEGQNQIDAWNEFFSDILEPKIIEAQFTAELQNKSAELEGQLQKIIELAKSGQLDDPSTLILAITKVNIEKNGLIFTQLSKRVMNLNEKANTITNKVYNSSNFDKDVMVASQDLKNVGTQTQLLMNNLGQCAQYAQSQLTTADSMIKGIKSTKDEIIRKISGS